MTPPNQTAPWPDKCPFHVTRINTVEEPQASGYSIDDANAEIDHRWFAYGPMLKALKEIQKGEGAFSRDPLIHAGNCIEDMKALATAAIRAAEQADA